MLGQIFLTSCLVMMTSCWRIDVSEKNVAIQLSPNVTLECRNDGGNDNNTMLVDIDRLRILKRNHNNQWEFVAKVKQHPNLVETSLPNVVVNGKAHNLSDSFIELQFPLATQETIGQFLCEVDGYDGREEWEQFKTKPVVIKERGVTFQDVLSVMYRIKKQNKAEHVDNQVELKLLEKSINLLEIKENSTSKLLKKLTVGGILDNRISKKIDNITNKIQGLHNDFLRVSNKQKSILRFVKSVTKKDSSEIWPTGTYSLLRPIDGCPLSPSFVWQMSSVRLTTKPGAHNQDKLSLPSHLPPNTLQHESSTGRNYVNMTMCSKNVITEGANWPKGSYCINWNTACPAGLSGGNMYFGRYDDGSSKDSIVNYPSFTGWETKERTNIPYCCRNDGSASHPIALPAIDPFYLYRYGGECQEVKNMIVSNEWMLLDSNKEHDKYNNNYHADGQIKPVGIEICYYKPCC